MIKNSVGIWAFGPAVTRFVPPGYHHEVADEPMVDKRSALPEVSTTCSTASNTITRAK